MLENIFLVNLFYSTDKIFGNANIFRKVLNELKYLEDTGITVVTEDEIIQVYFAMCLFTGDKNLTPKMHINIHYPNIIPEIGPLEPLSCIRMEAKHREGKQIAHSSANRINLPYSIAKRHQQNFAIDYWLEEVYY